MEVSCLTPKESKLRSWHLNALSFALRICRLDRLSICSFRKSLQCLRLSNFLFFYTKERFVQTHDVNMAFEPLAFEPLASEPLAFEPLASEPLQFEPLAFEPLASEPLAFEPLASEPLAFEPLAFEPVPRARFRLFCREQRTWMHIVVES